MTMAESNLHVMWLPKQVMGVLQGLQIW